MGPPPDLAIRPARTDDEPAILELWCSAWETVAPGLDLRAQWDEMRQQWTGLLATGAQAFVAEQHRLLVGLLVLDGPGRRLEQLAVQPVRMGRGIGTALTRFAQAQASGRLDLVVNTFNARAARLYERCGFQRLGEDVDKESGLPVWRYTWARPSVTSAYNS